MAFGLGAAFTGVLATSEKAEAHTKTLADVPMEVEWNSSAAPGVVFLGQTDGTWTPGAAAFPAAVAGWTTFNTNLPNGVYGYSAVAGGNAVVGLGVSGALAGFFPGTFRSPETLRYSGLRTQPSRTRTAPIGVSTLSRAPRAGSRISDRARSRAARPRSGWTGFRCDRTQ